MSRVTVLSGFLIAVGLVTLAHAQATTPTSGPHPAEATFEGKSLDETITDIRAIITDQGTVSRSDTVHYPEGSWPDFTMKWKTVQTVQDLGNNCLFLVNAASTYEQSGRISRMPGRFAVQLFKPIHFVAVSDPAGADQRLINYLSKKSPSSKSFDVYGQVSFNPLIYLVAPDPGPRPDERPELIFLKQEDAERVAAGLNHAEQICVSMGDRH